MHAFAAIPVDFARGCSTTTTLLSSISTVWMLIVYIVAVGVIVYKLRSVREAYGVKVCFLVCVRCRLVVR